MRTGSRLLLAIAGAAMLTACRQDMHNQPKYRGLRESAFFADGSSARPLIEGTDPQFERGRTFEFLKTLGAKEINEVHA